MSRTKPQWGKCRCARCVLDMARACSRAAGPAALRHEIKVGVSAEGRTWRGGRARRTDAAARRDISGEGPIPLGPKYAWGWAEESLGKKRGGGAAGEAWGRQK